MAEKRAKDDRGNPVGRGFEGCFFALLFGGDVGLSFGFGV
jgi:hypothetical protein